MTAAHKIFKFLIVKHSSCNVVVNVEMFPFAKLFIEIIDNLQTKRVKDLKFPPDFVHRLRIKISILTKGNFLKSSFLANDGSTLLPKPFLARGFQQLSLILV